MGAWGTGLFCDDVACDIQAEFRDRLAVGASVPQATRQILERWAEAVEDEEDGPVIWLALASLQWDRGALQSRVKSKALRIIDSGADLKRWEAEGDSYLVGQRRAVLRKLRKKLESPPPDKKLPKPNGQAAKRKAKSPKPPVEPILWQLGEVFAYKLRSGDWILLHIIACSNARPEDITPYLAVLDWRGTELLAAAQIKQLPYRLPPLTTYGWEENKPKIGERRLYCCQAAHRKQSSIPRKRIQRLGIQRKLPFKEFQGWVPGVLWSLFDKQLEYDLGLS